MKFYKGVLLSDLNNLYIPGTVTTEFKVALEWKERINSNKRKGAAKHVRHGKSVIIEFDYHDELLSFEEFQRSGVEEHKRLNCWTSSVKDKAQINTAINYNILTESDIEKLFSW